MNSLKSSIMTVVKKRDQILSYLKDQYGETTVYFDGILDSEQAIVIFETNYKITNHLIENIESEGIFEQEKYDILYTGNNILTIAIPFDSILDRTAYDISYHLQKFDISTIQYTIRSDEIEITSYLEGKVDQYDDFQSQFAIVEFTVSDSAVLQENYSVLVDIVETESRGLCYLYQTDLSENDSFEVLISQIDIAT